MKLTILGGGGFRVPLVYGALLDDGPGRVSEVTLYDIDPVRLAAIGQVLRQMGAGASQAPAVTETLDLDEALAGADFVFSAIRVGGVEGRTVDERVALDLGVLGQETTGPGGLAYALRTLPVALGIAERVKTLAPDAWFINFTNPAGIVTEAVQTVLGERAIGICDSPISLVRRAIHASGVSGAEAQVDYVGLNHLGWLRRLVHDGRDVLADLLARPDLLSTFEEGRLFGADWLRALGSLPNEYLYYYYFTREAVASMTAAPQTRGEFLRDQQTAFYTAVAAAPQDALREWHRAREERETTYMKEARGAAEERDAADIAGGGYEGVALSLMRAISGGPPATMILNVRNGTAQPGLPPDAVIEVPCTVDANGARPLPLPAAEGHMLGLMQQVKAVERLVIRAVLDRDADAAWAAYALHPLVDSVSAARALVDEYRRRSPEIAALFD